MKKLLTGLLLAGVILLGLSPRLAYAAGLADGRVVFGGSTLVGNDEVVTGDIVVFGGNVTVAQGGRVAGSVVIFGGNVSVAGAVDGDLVAFGGSGNLAGTARVRGQLVTLGAAIHREAGAQVEGGESRVGSGPPDFVIGPRWPGLVFVGAPLSRAAGVILNAAVLAALALLVVIFWPDQTARVAETVARAPLHSGGMGLLTGVAAPVLLVLMAITICLIPLSLLGSLLFAATLLFGWIALGLLVGNRVAVALNWQSLSPAAAGTPSNSE